MFLFLVLLSHMFPWMAINSLLRKTRDAFPAAKIRKEGFGKVFNVWTKSYFSNLLTNICRWFLNGQKWLVNPSKLRNRVFLGKCSKWNLNFQNWSKAFCLGVSESTKRLAAQSTAYALRNRQGKQAFIKESEKISV